MAYEKQNFEDGQTLTAENLNHIETGIEELNTLMSTGIIHIGADAPTDERAVLWIDTDEESDSTLPNAEEASF